MSFQAYLDNIKAKTVKTPEDFAAFYVVSARTCFRVRQSSIEEWIPWLKPLGAGRTLCLGALARNAQEGVPRPNRRHL